MNGAGPIASAVYVARIGDPDEDRDRVLAVWHDALSQQSRLHAAKYEWFHRRGQPDASLLALVEHVPTDACVGTSAVGARRMLWRGHEIRAGVMADMAISAQHRTLGPVLTLQAGLLASASGRFDWLYGFPNTKSIAVAKRAGFPVIGQLRRYSRVLRHGDYLVRVLPRPVARVLGWFIDTVVDARRWLQIRLGVPCITTTWSDHADHRMDELWQTSEHGDGCVAIRDAAFLQWRFDEYPGAITRYLCLSEPGQKTLLAWFACQVEGHTLHVRDFWSRDAANGMPRRQLEALLRAARLENRKLAAVSFEYATDKPKLNGWLAAGFVERSHRSIIGRCLTGGGLDLGTAHLTAADEDE
jgi:hypothetical protein